METATGGLESLGMNLNTGESNGQKMDNTS